jgi:hypothetical protein
MKPLPTIYTRKADPLRRIRDNDRREYRTRIIWVLALNLLVMVGLRLGIDLLFEQRQMAEYQHLKPYTMLVLLGFFFAIWVLGIWVAFKRNY